MILRATISRRSFLTLAGAVAAAVAIPPALARAPAQGGFLKNATPYLVGERSPCTAQLLNARGDIVMRDATITISEASDASMSLRALFPVITDGYKEIASIQILRSEMILFTSMIGTKGMGSKLDDVGEPLLMCVGNTVQVDMEINAS